MADDKQSEMAPTNSTLRHAGKQTINTFPSTLNNSTRSTRNDLFRYSHAFAKLKELLVVIIELTPIIVNIQNSLKR